MTEPSESPYDNNAKFVQQMRDGAVKLGIDCNLSHPIAAELIACYGWDFVMVDCQHSPVNREKLPMMLQAIKLGGAKSFVRVEGPDDRYGIQQAFDCGADGILVPFIRTPADVEQLVSYAKFPGSMGKEGTRSLFINLRKTFPAGAGTTNIVDMHNNANRGTIIAIQIETASAAENLDEILKVPGVDIAFIGPGDLNSSMGALYEKGFAAFGDPTFLKVMEDVVTKSPPNNVVPGIWGMDVKASVAGGFKWIIAGTDFEYMRSAMDAHRKQIMEEVPNWKPRPPPVDPSLV